MLDSLRLKRFDRGLSKVDTEEPDTSDGVLEVKGASTLGRREEDFCEANLGAVKRGAGWVLGRVGVTPPWRDTEAIGAFDVGAF